MTEWTAARLDALPDCTVIEVWREDWQCWVRFVWDGEVWQEPGEYDSYQSARFAGLRIRVVSVPVDALRSKATERAVYERTLWGSESIPEIINAAVAHVTGEQS